MLYEKIQLQHWRALGRVCGGWVVGNRICKRMLQTCCIMEWLQHNSGFIPRIIEWVDVWTTRSSGFYWYGIVGVEEGGWGGRKHH